MPVTIKIAEMGGSGTADSRREYRVEGDASYRASAVQGLAMLSHAVETQLDTYRKWEAQNRVAMFRARMGW